MAKKKSKKQRSAAVLFLYNLHRLSVGKSQTQVAKDGGMNQAHINQIFNGNKSPTLETLDKLAKGCNCQVHEFFLPPAA